MASLLFSLLFFLSSPVLSLTFPSLSFPTFPSLPSFPSDSLPASLSPSPSCTPPRSLRGRSPLFQLRDMGSAASSSSGVPKSILVHFSFKMRHLLATILMIFVRINCPNVIGLVWRPPYLPYRFRRHWPFRLLGRNDKYFVNPLTGQIYKFPVKN